MFSLHTAHCDFASRCSVVRSEGVAASNFIPPPSAREALSSTALCDSVPDGDKVLSFKVFMATGMIVSDAVRIGAHVRACALAEISPCLGGRACFTKSAEDDFDAC